MNNEMNSLIYSPMIDRALGFAARHHEGQHRKVGGVPYIAHPMGVAAILMRMGCRDEVIAAAILHDTVEDTNVTIEDIRVRFGQEVAEIVAGCTELPQNSNKWEDRKLEMIERLRHASPEVKLVIAADKYHNLHHISRSKNKTGSAVWKRFGRGVESQAWYYRAVLKSITYGIPEYTTSYPIFQQLAVVIDELFEGISPNQPLTESRLGGLIPSCYL